MNEITMDMTVNPETIKDLEKLKEQSNVPKNLN